MTMTLTILGCGSSGGVPRVGQGWGACDPANPRNRRRRCSILLTRHAYNARSGHQHEDPLQQTATRQTTNVLIDLSPDLREQLLDADVSRLDAILLTHAHADHIHGIDDVRPLVIQQRERINVYMDAPTATDTMDKFGYIFKTPAGSHYPPLLIANPLTPGIPVTLEGPGGSIEAMPVLFHHGMIDALGYRFGNTAYSPDLSDIPPESMTALENLDLWIIDALRYTSHPSHITVAQALSWIERLRPRRAILTNLHTDLDYATLAAELPSHVIPAYDGMKIKLSH